MSSNSCSQDYLDPKDVTHRPALVSGSFYPENPDTLRSMIEQFLDSPEPTIETPDVFGIVAPHAGYVYSGWIAGKAYKQVAGKKYDAIVVIGPSHQKAFKGSSVFNGQAYTTPLGIARVDETLAVAIAKAGDGVNLSLNGHSWDDPAGEHSIEVQIPFLQVVQPDVPIVPICMGSQDSQAINKLAEAIVGAVKETKKRILVVASSDLSHFHNKEEARKIDLPLTKSFARYDYYKMMYQLSSRECEACGGGPIVVAMMVAEWMGATQSLPIFYGTSADSPYARADESRVVGYFTGAMARTEVDSFDNLPKLDKEEIEMLKQSALKGVENAVKGDSSIKMRYVPMALSKEFAAFVTLKKGGRLRGCMGHTVASKPLMVEVEESGRMAAVRDPRFPKVEEDELDDIDFEVTILTRFKKVFDLKNFQAGRDGAILRVGYSSGLFLPQVATENNWDNETFLRNLGRKAGLDYDAYKDPDAELYKFRAVVID